MTVFNLHPMTNYMDTKAFLHRSITYLHYPHTYSFLYYLRICIYKFFTGISIYIIILTQILCIYMSIAMINTSIFICTRITYSQIICIHLHKRIDIMSGPKCPVYLVTQCHTSVTILKIDLRV